jgi:hypothetical protein
MNYYTGYCEDMAAATEGDEAKSWAGLVELLTPIVKAYCSDKAWAVAETAIQVLGGYGFCSEYRVEQCARDVKIASLYEGTNGIQAMDLLGRKLPMAGGKLFAFLMSRMDEPIKQAKSSAALKPYAERLEHGRAELTKITQHVGQQAGGKEFLLGFLNATPLLEIFGDVISGWMLLWQAAIAEKKFESLANAAGAKDEAARKKLIRDNHEAAYLAGKVQSARFMIGTQLPKVDGKVLAILSNETAALEIEEVSFS